MANGVGGERNIARENEKWFIEISFLSTELLLLSQLSTTMSSRQAAPTIYIACAPYPATAHRMHRFCLQIQTLARTHANKHVYPEQAEREKVEAPISIEEYE